VGPIPQADGHDRPRLIDELGPGLAAVIENVVVGCEDPVGDPVLPHKLPDILDRFAMMPLNDCFLLRRSPDEVVRRRLAAELKLANPGALPQALQVVAAAEEVSHSDNSLKLAPL
jgi:hypothetical protein